MSQKLLVFEAKKCIGCRLCEQMCVMSHFKVSNPSKSRIRIIRDDEKQLDTAIYCHLCSDAKCIEACEFNVLSRDTETKAILVNEEECTACERCVEECPFSHPIMHPTDDYVLICDLCKGSPVCAEICPEDAIQYLDKETHEGN
jgi:Fe-S-cluster-containing hydrogenase component 2